MFNAVIFDTESGRIVRTFDTLRGAKCSFTRTYKTGPKETSKGVVDSSGLKAVSITEYMLTGHVTAEEKIVVYSIFDMKRERPIQIRRADVGTCCDPSTETYHTM